MQSGGDGSGSEASTDERPAKFVEEFSSTHLSYNGTASTTVSDLHVLGGFGVGLVGSNCLHISDEVSMVHSGWVEASWQGPVPDLGMELRMIAEPRTEVSGMSPLRVDLNHVKPDTFFEDYSIALMPLAGTGPRAELQVTCTFELTDYDGPIEPDWDLAGECAFG